MRAIAARSTSACTKTRAWRENLVAATVSALALAVLIVIVLTAA